MTPETKEILTKALNGLRDNMNDVDCRLWTDENIISAAKEIGMTEWADEKQAESLKHKLFGGLQEIFGNGKQ